MRYRYTRLSLVYVYLFVCTHVLSHSMRYSHTHTQCVTLTHTHMHIHTHSRAHTLTHTHVHIRSHTYAHTYMYTRDGHTHTNRQWLWMTKTFNHYSKLKKPTRRTMYLALPLETRNLQTAESVWSHYQALVVLH